MILVLKLIKRRIRSKWHNYKNYRYWSKYYKSHRDMLQPSSFAKYCYKNYCLNTQNASLLELGCGNGRDSLFFMNKGLNVLGTDIIKEQLTYLRKKYKSNQNISFKCADFTDYKQANSFDYIYSRFTIHSITEEQETETLSNSYRNLKHGGLFFVEVRSIKDEMYNKSQKISLTEGKTDHYRRFIIYDKFIQKIKNTGFKILYSVESQGLAKYKTEDPFVIRVIAKKI
jgi:cyclopropane fatty-acyl-phospholipid synthase-like methyltransferase